MNNVTSSSEFLDLQSALAGEYSLQRELGRGGMGIVYLARDVQLDRNVAIKVLPSHLAARAEDRERFLREARTAAGLSHPHIVPIHRVGEAGGFVFFVMSYVAGETLGERLRRAGPLPAAEAMRVMREVAWALAHAHGRGIVHRDVKPDNILLEEDTGRVLVTDFGIAYRGDAVTATDPGKIMGTAHFMSPEQGSSMPVDGRSDLYSLGVVGYLAASGRLPFEGAGLPALLLKQSTDEPPALSSVAPGLPAALVRAVERCLRLDASERFASGEELAAALAPSNEDRPSLPAPLRSWLRERNPATIAYAAWSGLVGIPLFYDVTQFLNHGNPYVLMDILQLGVIAAAPLVPMLGYHSNRAKRLFRSGFTLADLRGALDVAANERREDEGEAGALVLSRSKRMLRRATYTSAALSMVLTFLPDTIQLRLQLRHVVIPLGAFQLATLGLWLTTMVLLVSTNTNDVPLIPSRVRRFFSGGIRERLWRSRAGEWLARRLGAPTVSRPVGAGVFQATELALGIAAADLFGRLPAPMRDQLSELPDVVARLEQRATSARELLKQLDSHGMTNRDSSGELATRRDAVRRSLAETVGALEGIRIDLLRLHAGATDLAPLTTLLDAARVIGEEVSRMAEAQREVERVVAPRRIGARPMPTPV